MTSEQRAQAIVSAIIEICRVDLGKQRRQVEACITGHLNELERSTAEKSVAVMRAKSAEASDAVLSQTAIGRPSVNPKFPPRYATTATP